MLETDGKLFLGKNLKTKTPLLYDPADLTTHAVVVGMTGSGKTGLCIDLLEEAALNNVPALMIDPKGDITNTLLHFPDLLPADFQPWVNPDEARRAGKSVEEASADAASTWSEGLEKWGIGKERIQALSNSAHFAIYTPGSDAGIPINILASLRAPEIPWKGNEESIREKISGTVTALLGLVGLKDIDPVRSREHILLANIFEYAWSRNRDLDLGELILQTQNPPFEKLGVLDLETFFSKDDRFDLSMMLNNILAAPTFQSWIKGQALDIQSLLYSEDGRPRHSVFYIAHLSESERMFFVTLLYAALETWMRAQSGTNSLRALIYFDEIYGYMPPVANPSSKSLMLRMLKQGRAFGVGQVLVTQNPSDIDYKALSNAGTWMIGRLQTDNDKQRLLDGLEGATSSTFNKKTYDKIISKLGKRQFLLHNVHASEPQVFETRWAMNYLAGPMTRNQIPALNELAGAKAPAVDPVSVPADKRKGSTPAEEDSGMDSIQAMSTEELEDAPMNRKLGSSTRPTLPTSVAEYFLPNNLTLSESLKHSKQNMPARASSQGLLYRPVLFAQAEIRYFQRKYELDHDITRAAIVPDPDPRGVVRWEDFTARAIDPNSLDRQVPPDARFGTLEPPFSEGKVIKSMQGDFVDFLYRRSSVIVHANVKLKMYAGPQITEGEFRKEVSEAARDGRDAELKKLETAYKKKFAVLRRRLTKEERELDEDKAEHAQRRMVELSTHFENVFTSSRHRRRISSSLSKRRLTQKAKADIEESVEVIEEIERDIDLLEDEFNEVVDEVEEKWAEIASEIDEISVTPFKKDILIDLFGVAWMPYHLVDANGQLIELPAFAS